MQMKDGLARARIAVDHRPVAALCNAFLRRNFSRNLKQSAKQLGILRLRIVQGWDGLARDHQDMHRRLRIDIAKGDDLRILINDVGGDVAGQDPAENGL